MSKIKSQHGQVVLGQSTDSMQCPVKFFTDLKRTILYFIWKNIKPRTAKAILYNKGTSGGITIPDFKLYYRATVMKTAYIGLKTHRKDQWNRIEDPDINPHTCEHCYLTKKQKISNRKKKAYLTNGAGITGCQIVEE